MKRIFIQDWGTFPNETLVCIDVLISWAICTCIFLAVGFISGWVLHAVIM